MPSVQGSGPTVGAAFREAVSQVSLGAPRPSYTRSTPAGQFRQLFGSARGYQALAEAGLQVRQARTLQGWLEGTSTPNRANAAAIGRAYQAMQVGGTPPWVRTGTMTITGLIATGEDARERSLVIQLSSGDWDHIDQLLTQGADDDELEEAIAADLIGPDIGDGSDGWSFPGNLYTVDITWS